MRPLLQSIPLIRVKSLLKLCFHTPSHSTRRRSRYVRSAVHICHLMAFSPVLHAERSDYEVYAKFLAKKRLHGLEGAAGWTDAVVASSLVVVDGTVPVATVLEWFAVPPKTKYTGRVFNFVRKKGCV